MEKILLLHGPLRSTGINSVTQQLFKTEDVRAKGVFPFQAEANTFALSTVFRAHGYKIVYSGWDDDREWLEANRELFDVLVLSDQSNLKDKDVRQGFVIPNHKERFFFGVYRGLEAVQQHYGADAVVFRLRSDMAVRVELAQEEINKAIVKPGILLIDYLDPANLLRFPDFMTCGRVKTVLALFQDMALRSIAGEGYHVSSHIEHGLTAARLQQEGVIGEIGSMSRALFDSLVWRGIPRYLEYGFTDYQEMAFGMIFTVPPNLNLQEYIDNIPAVLSGRSAP